MKIYTLKKSQFLPISIEYAWEFFSSPQNLSKITPTHMGFRIISVSGSEKMYAGQIIKYIINVFPWWPVNWTTEITHVREPFFFVDEQRFGPYRLWHHQHHFKAVEGGVEMIDEINYGLPLGFMGQFAHSLFVKRQLNTIFDYRFQTLNKIFKKERSIDYSS